VSGPDDPYGRRSLFSATSPADDEAGDSSPGGPTGRGSLYGRSGRRERRVPGSMTVVCSRCGGRRTLTPLSLALRLVPSLWWPLAGRWSRYLRCPACGDWSWCALERPGGAGRR
jgi:hypothetical protein